MEIESGDTVRITGEPEWRTWVVESSVRRMESLGEATVTHVGPMRRGDGITTVCARDVELSRLELVRKGNQETDDANFVLVAAGLEPIPYGI